MNPTRLNLAPRTLRWFKSQRRPSLLLGASVVVIILSVAAYGAQLSLTRSAAKPAAEACPAQAMPPPSSGWAGTGTMKTARSSHSATLLRDGKVLVAGGEVGPIDPNTETTRSSSAELYDPKTGTWSPTGSMRRARAGHTALPLVNGNVLVLGGDGLQVTAELYNPDTGTWSSTTGLTGQRPGFAATLLRDGKVLVTGGGEQASAAVYDPAAQNWTQVANMGTPRRSHAATLLDGGLVLVAGGINNVHTAGLDTAEVYDPASDTWSATGSMARSRETEDGPRHQQLLLQNRQVLAVGGGGRTGALDAAERYHESTGSWSGASSTRVAREQGHTLTPLSYGRILLVGGRGDAGTIAEAELYDPAANAWTVVARSTTPRLAHTATNLSDGRVLVAGGRGAKLEVLANAELFPARACPPSAQAVDKQNAQGGNKPTTQARGKPTSQVGDKQSTQASEKQTTRVGDKQTTRVGEKPTTQVSEWPTGGVETGGGDATRWEPALPIGELAKDGAQQQVRLP
jgi:Kelch motif/Galactose oxidase, central domain